MRVTTLLLVVLILTAGLAGCGMDSPKSTEPETSDTLDTAGADTSDTTDTAGADPADQPNGNPSTAMATEAIEPGEVCEYGGVSIDVGIDENRNGVLDAEEVDNTVVLCNGATGAEGTSGDSALIEITPLESGHPECPYGGYVITAGVDDDRDGILAPEEVDSSLFQCDPAPPPWQTKAAMPTPRYQSTSEVVNGKIYVIGGMSADHERLYTVEEYDPATDLWTTKAPMPRAGYWNSSAVWDGEIYVADAYNAISYFSRYDPATDTWTTSLSQPNYGGSADLIALNGLIYQPYSSQVYDPVLDTWLPHSAPSCFLGSQGPQGESVAVNGVIYALGRVVSIGNYDPLTGTRPYPDATLWVARAYLTSAVAGDRIYTFGGQGENNTEVLDIVREFDTATGNVFDGTPMPTPRYNSTSSTVNGKIYVIGGLGGASGPTLGLIEEYDPSLDGR